MHAVVVRRELLSSRHPSNIPPFCKIGGQNRKIQCALINQGFSQKATSKTLKILTFLCLFSSPERRSIRRCTEFHLKLKIRWANTPCGFESHFRHHRRTLIWIQLGPFFFAPLPCEKVLILWDFSASRARILAREFSSFMLIQSIFDHLQ